MADVLPDYEGGAGRRVEATPVHAPTMAPALSGYAITPSSSELDPPVKALWANQACTVTMTGADAVSFSVTVDGAGPIPFAPVKVTAVDSGTVIGVHDETV